MNSDRRTTPDRQFSDRMAPLPGSPEAHAQGCTCPDPGNAAPPSAGQTPAGQSPAGQSPAGQSSGQPIGQPTGRAFEIDENCPVHGRAAIAWDRDSERGPIDTEGDIVDSASEPELRRNR